MCSFYFVKVFSLFSQQRDLYEQAITPIVSEVLEGFDCTIFAYCQTGTRKTYTMEGECKKAKVCFSVLMLCTRKLTSYVSDFI